MKEGLKSINFVSYSDLTVIYEFLAFELLIKWEFDGDFRVLILCSFIDLKV